MANKNVKINFDFDNESVKFATDRVVGLAEQVRILKKELGRDDLSAQQFKILSNTLNETTDKLNSVNARSRELFGTLSLIPGPIGQIASKIDGTISLLKTFSSFKLSDLRTQVAGFLADAGGIVQTLGKATGITKLYTTLNNFLAQSFIKVGVGEAAATAGAKAFSAAIIASGVGALLVLLGTAVSSFMEYADSTDEATIAQNKFNAAIDRTNQLLDADLASAKRRQAEGIANLKKSGASEKQIRDQGVQDLKENLKLTQNALSEAAATENAIMKSGNGDLKKAQEATAALENKKKDLQTQINVAIVENQIATNKELEQARKDNAAKEKKYADDKKQRDQKMVKEIKDDLDAQIQLEIDKGNTDAKVLEGLLAKRLAFEDLKGNALLLAQQKNAKTVTDAVEEDKKAQDQTIKNTEDFNRKIQDIKTAAIVDDVEREKQARTDKLNRDLADLEKDVEFIKKSEEDKEEIRKNVRTAYDNDIKKIQEAANQKEIDEDAKTWDKKLRLLELKGQGLIQGTKSYYENKLEILKLAEQKELSELDLQYATGLISEEKYQKDRQAIVDKYAKAYAQTAKDRANATLMEVSMVISGLANLADAFAANLEEESKLSKSAFEKRKKLLIAGAVMQGAAGILNIIATPPPPFMDFVTAAVLKGIQIGTVIATTATQISKISKTTFEGAGGGETAERRKLAQGGYVSGPGTSTSDSIPANLSNGEFVMNARSTAAFLPMLSAMNAAGNQPRFAAGGLVSSPASMSTSEDITRMVQSSIDRPIKTYVVATDMSNQQQFDRAIKSRSTI